MKSSMPIILLWIVFRDKHLTAKALDVGHKEFDSRLDRTSRQISRGYYYEQPIEDEDVDEIEDLKQNIPGIPGSDYPIYAEVPQTGFNCVDQDPQTGYFADVDAQCQVFHICQENGKKDSFLCPNGTIFHQRFFVCVWWYEFDCSTAPGLYQLNYEIGKEGPYSYRDPTLLIKPSGSRPREGNLLHSSNLSRESNRETQNGKSTPRRILSSSPMQFSSGFQRMKSPTGQNIRFTNSNFQNDNVLTRNRFSNNDYSNFNFKNLNTYSDNTRNFKPPVRTRFNNRNNKQDYNINNRNSLAISGYRQHLSRLGEVDSANRNYLPPTSQNLNDPPNRQYLPPPNQELDEVIGMPNRKHSPPMKDSIFNGNSKNRNPERKYLPPSDDPGHFYDKPQNLSREYVPPNDYQGQDATYNNPNRNYLPPSDDSVHYYEKPNKFSDQDSKYLPPISSRDFRPKTKDIVVIGRRKSFENNNFQKQNDNANKPSREYLPPVQTSNDNQNQNDNFESENGGNDNCEMPSSNLKYLPPDSGYPNNDDFKSAGCPSKLEDPVRQYLPPTFNK